MHLIKVINLQWIYCCVVIVIDVIFVPLQCDHVDALNFNGSFVKIMAKAHADL